MQEDNNVDYSIAIKNSLAIRALRRSSIRKRTVEYLSEISPNCSYTSEIAYHIGATSSNVIGALRGIDTRYKEDDSLISLQIVEEQSGGKNIRLYRVTPYGKEIVESFKQRR